jgi:two-component system, LytTR family, sensor kinase
MHFFSENREILIILLVKLGIVASLSALLARSLKFKRTLYAEPRGFQEKLNLVLFWGVPLAIGVGIRIGLGYPAFDLTLEGTFVAGLLGGNVVGLIVGCLVGLTAMILHREWLALPMAAILGLASGILRNLTPRKEEIWNFSPFVLSNIFQSLRSRLQFQKVLWQWILQLSCLLFEGFFYLVDQNFPPRWLFHLPSNDPLQVDLRSDNALMLLLIFVGTLSCVGLTLKIWNNTRLEMKLAEQEVLVVKSRLDALANQINPHFLFNTLNSISSLIRTNPSKARTMVIKLSHILRKLLQGHENFISLREELELIDNYLDIEVIRFGKEKLRIEKEVESDTLACMIPSMILQPIVENSIKHGISPRIEGGVIKIRSTRIQDRISIEVEDNGVGIAEEEIPKIYNSGIGISNIIERLKVMYHSDYVFSVRSFPGHGTFTHIEIPLQESLVRERAG